MDQNFINACNKLKLLNEQSKGKPIELENGEIYIFRKLRNYSDNEILSLEKNNNYSWPTEFKYFLKEVGIGEFYMDEYNLGIEFIPLDKIVDNQSEIFENPSDNPFPKLIIVSLLSGRGDFGGFNLDIQKSNNFGIFSGEEPPEEWINPEHTLVDFSEWLIELVISDGENDMPPY